MKPKVHEFQKTNFKVMSKKYFFLLLLISVSIYSQQKGLIADKAMVVSAREEASKIGIDIVKKGCNAVDAPRFHNQWLPDDIMVEPKNLIKSSLKI